jgi:hypothetical protein
LYPISSLVNERSQALELQIGCSDVDVFGADDLWMREKEKLCRPSHMEDRVFERGAADVSS